MKDTRTGGFSTKSTSCTSSTPSPPTDSAAPTSHIRPSFSFGRPATSDPYPRPKKSSDTVTSGPSPRPKKSSDNIISNPKDLFRFPRFAFSNDTLATLAGAKSALEGFEFSPFSLPTSTDPVKTDNGDDGDYITDIVSAKRKLEIKAKRTREAGDSLIEEAKKIEKKVKLINNLLSDIKK